MAVVSCISLFFLQTRQTRRARPRLAGAQQKTRRGLPPGRLAYFRWIRFSGRFSLHESRGLWGAIWRGGVSCVL